jgi:hypothetical protein
MDDEFMVHLHNEILFIPRKTEIMSFAEKWKELQSLD